MILKTKDTIFNKISIFLTKLDLQYIKKEIKFFKPANFPLRS